MDDSMLGTMVVVTLMFGVLWAWACYQMAKGKGYDGGGAAVVGFMFGLFAVIVYAVLPKKEQNP